MTRSTVKFFTILSFIFLSLGFAGSAAAQDGALNKDDINQLIKTFIQENPQVIIDSLEQYQRDQEAKVEAEAAQNLAQHQSYLENGDLPRVGNPNADIKIVEFYDYNCGYCKRAFSDLQILLEADENVQVTFVEMPILGESSLETSKWALASIKQGKFFDYHTALMKFSGGKTPETLKSLAAASGLDVAALEEATKDPAIIDSIEKNISIARDIGIRGTPGFIINGQIYRGYLGYDGLKAVIDEIRLANNPDEGQDQTDDE